MRSLIRYLFALLSAAVIPTVVFTVPASSFVLHIRPPVPYYTGQDIAGLAAITLIVASVFVIVLGTPVLLILILAHLTKWIRWWSTALVGFILGCIPPAILLWPPLYACSPCSNSFTEGGNLIVTMVNGVVTTAGWIDYAKTVSYIGLLGILGGISFWVSLKLSDRQVVIPNSETSEHDLEKPMENSFIKVAMVSFHAIVIIFTGVIITGMLITQDNSCHNLFRGGRTSIEPSLNMNLQIANSERTNLKALLQAFATKNNMSFVDVGIHSPDLPQSFYLSVCNEDGVNFETEDDFALSGVSITVYIQKNNTNWMPLTKQLIADLNNQWPNKLQFIGSRGEVIPEPTSLSTANP
jgi:hypothetical protein